MIFDQERWDAWFPTDFDGPVTDVMRDEDDEE